MFNDIREQRKNTFTYILVGLAGVGMLFLGVPLFTQSSSQQNILKVNEMEVPVDTLKTQISRLQSQFPNMDPQAIEQQALSVLINQSLLDQHALNSDYQLSKPALFKLVKSQYGNDEAYQAALTKMRTSAPAYEAAMSRQQTIQNYYQFLSNSNLNQKAIFEQFLRSASQTRDYTVFRLPLEPVMASLEVNEAGIQSYYDAHQDQYQTPELVDLEYVVLDATKIISADQINADDIEAAKQEAIRQNTKRSGRYIIFDDDKQAQQTQQALTDNSQTFDEVYAAVDSGDISGEAGELPLGAHGSGPSEAVDDALFALEKSGDVSDILSTDHGPMLVSLTEIQTQAIPSDEEIIADLRAKAGKEEYDDRAARAVDAAFANKPFTQVVDITGAEAQKLSQITADSAQPEWLQNTKVADQLFGENAIAVDKNGEPIELNNQRSVFYHVISRTKPTLKPLDDVKTQVETDALRDKAKDVLTEQSEVIAEALRNGEDVSPLIEQYQTKKEALNAISLYSSTEEVDPNLLDTFFQQEQRVNVSTASNGDWLVTYLEAVHDGDLADISDDVKDGLFREWQRNANLEIQNSYSSWLREKADIAVYENNLPSSSL